MSKIIKIMCNLKYAKYRPLPFTNTRIACRKFHINTRLCVKMVMEHENKYAYSIMENNGYTINLNTATNTDVLSQDQFDKLVQEDWSKKPPQLLFEVFSKFGAYCSQNNLCISNNIFDSYIDNLTDNIKLASDRELQSLFYSLMTWPETPSIRSRNFIEVWVALDDECLNRTQKWTFDECLTYMALFYMISVTKVSEFSSKCLNKLASKARRLTPHQLVQTFFYIGVFRKQPFDMHYLEVHLFDNFSFFSVDDLAIVSMGLFKSKTPLRNMELMLKIIDKVIENSQDIHEVSLAALLKIIRFSLKIPSDKRIYMLLDTLQHQVPRLSVMCNVHLALLGTSTLTLHEDCLTKVAKHTVNYISKSRLKDLERLVFTFGTFNIFPQTKECFFQKVIEELRSPQRQVEIEQHGRSFACCVTYLAMLGIYPVDLMSKVLNPEFLQETYGKQIFTYGREVLSIHNSAEIFYSETEMNRLSQKTAIVLSKKYTDYAPNANYKKEYNVTEKMFLDIVQTLEDYRGGSDYVKGGHILTHHQRGDVILCNTHDGLPAPIADDTFTTKNFGLITRPPDNNLWIVLIIAGRNSLIRDSNSATGPFIMKIRELKAIGYHTELVLWNIYSNLKTKEEKWKYLNTLIKQAIDKNN